MRGKMLALCLVLGTGLAMSNAAQARASAVTENEWAATLEEANTENTNIGVLEGVTKEGAQAKVESGAKKKKPKYTKAELRLMSAIIYCEANGEPYAGKKAVGIVVMNRLKAKGYPNTLKGVIYQRGQFGPARNGSLSRALANWDAGRFQSAAAKQCVKAAKEALEGDTKVKVGGKQKSMKGYQFFSGRMSNPRYRIGRHVFK